MRKGLRTLVRHVVQTASTRFGAFLLLEVWSGDDRDAIPTVDEATGETVLPPPGFRILARMPNGPDRAIGTLEFALQRIKWLGLPADVEINLSSRNHPPGMTQLVCANEAAEFNCHVLGLEVKPIYRDPRTGQPYPDVLRTLRRGVGRALKKAFFAYALDHTNVRPQHYFALGRKTLPRQVWNVDKQLAEVSSQADLLLQVTPVNAERAWREFEAGGFQREPKFQYRPLETNPILVKRRLMAIRTEEIEDPTLAHLFAQTQDELDRQVTMLADIGSHRFLPGSLQVFGGVKGSLLQLARELLETIPRNEGKSKQHVGAAEFARRASREMRYYHRQAAVFAGKALVREDMYSGLLSSGGNLLIGRETRVAAHARGGAAAARSRHALGDLLQRAGTTLAIAQSWFGRL